jgi:4'-phosphopantetheinyl transferase
VRGVTSLDVRVFSVDLDQPTAVVERLDAFLPAEERAVSAPIRVARATTRTLLAERLRTDPRSVPISRRCEHCGDPAHGRPTVAVDVPISFSLSHSGSFAVIAIVEGDARVGVDVEAVRPRGRLAALAARVLNDEEHEAWLALDDDDARLASFLRTWTAKEAYLKALGIGIATRLRDVPARVDGWTTCELEVGSGRVAALAIDRREFGVQHCTIEPLAMSSGGTAG